MILTEYDENEFRDFLREDSWKRGHKDGLETGIREIIKTCAEFQISKEKTLEKLVTAFSLSEEEANSYIEKYWHNLFISKRLLYKDF